MHVISFKKEVQCKINKFAIHTRESLRIIIVLHASINKINMSKENMYYRNETCKTLVHDWSISLLN